MSTRLRIYLPNLPDPRVGPDFCGRVELLSFLVSTLRRGHLAIAERVHIDLRIGREGRARGKRASKGAEDSERPVLVSSTEWLCGQPRDHELDRTLLENVPLAQLYASRGGP